MAIKYTNGATIDDVVAILNGYIAAEKRHITIPDGGDQSSYDYINARNSEVEAKIEILNDVLSHIKNVDLEKRTAYMTRKLKNKIAKEQKP